METALSPPKQPKFMKNPNQFRDDFNGDEVLDNNINHTATNSNQYQKESLNKSINHRN